MRTIGLDVHKRFAEVAIIEPGKPVRRADRISTAPDSLRAFVRTLGPTTGSSSSRAATPGR